MSVKSNLPQLRQPEYTGENRCLPCTIVNTGLALVAAVAIGLFIGGQTGVAVAGGLLAISAALIGFRGYLVPGTPTLTKRYFPDRVLAWFDKQPAPEPITDVDVETRLVDTGVLEPCRNRDDLCLESTFAEAWQTRIDATDAETQPTDALAVFMNEAEQSAIDSDAVDIEQHGSAYAAYVDNRLVAQWESPAAFVADRAAATLLADRDPAWDQLGFTARTELTGGLRLWLEACPNCGDPVAPGQDTVESCCRSMDVVAIQCTGCDSRLFEVEYDPAAAA